jgi:glycosyltransferase involved in cell wall biosynthesis
METVPAISVLMPVFNGQSHVGRAIDSIRGQTWSDWELIVVDDASTDRTAEIVEAAAAADGRIQLVRNEQNRGLAVSLNAAFARSSGELIARMDADDRALETRFDRQVGFLKEHPSIDVLGTAAWNISADGTRLGLYECRATHEEMAAHIYKENPFIHPSVMLHRRFLDALGGYDESFRRAQDYDLWLRGYRTFRYHNLSEPLLEYRMPAAMTWRGSISGARAIVSAGIRDGAPFRGAYYAARVLVRLAVSSVS